MAGVSDPNVASYTSDAANPKGVGSDEEREAVHAAAPAPAQQPGAAAWEGRLGPSIPRRPGAVMNAAMWVALLISAPVVGIGIYDLQTKLEQWTYERHAED